MRAPAPPLPACVTSWRSAHLTHCSAQNLAVSTVENGFFFNRRIIGLAARIVDSIDGTFNAVHLRLEGDVWHSEDDWNSKHGWHGMLQHYANSMQRLNFSQALPVYVASGLLIHGPSHGEGT